MLKDATSSNKLERQGMGFYRAAYTPGREQNLIYHPRHRLPPGHQCHQYDWREYGE